MAASRYEISLRVLKNREIFFQREKRNFVSRSGHVLFIIQTPMKYQIISL